MSIVLFQDAFGKYSLCIRKEKLCKAYHATIYNGRFLVYENWFSTIQNAKRALRRNLKNII